MMAFIWPGLHRPIQFYTRLAVHQEMIRLPGGFGDWRRQFEYLQGLLGSGSERS